ncbi:MAG: hypothetical protein ABSG65_16655 [Bryobacteraceae bacterium]
MTNITWPIIQRLAQRFGELPQVTAVVQFRRTCLSESAEIDNRFWEPEMSGGIPLPARTSISCIDAPNGLKINSTAVWYGRRLPLGIQRAFGTAFCILKYSSTREVGIAGYRTVPEFRIPTD